MTERNYTGGFRLSHHTPYITPTPMPMLITSLLLLASLLLVTHHYRCRGQKSVVKNVPPPAGPTGGPLRALIYDSVYDEYKVRCRVSRVRVD